jgi:hypothetical protein
MRRYNSTSETGGMLHQMQAKSELLMYLKKTCCEISKQYTRLPLSEYVCVCKLPSWAWYARGKYGGRTKRNSIRSAFLEFRRHPHNEKITQLRHIFFIIERDTIFVFSVHVERILRSGLLWTSCVSLRPEICPSIFFLEVFISTLTANVINQ